MVVEPTGHITTARHYRIVIPNSPVVVNGKTIGIRSMVVPGPNVLNLEPPPTFEVDQKVRIIGRPVTGVVREVVERDGRTMYGVFIHDPNPRPVIRSESVAYYGPERLE